MSNLIQRIFKKSSVGSGRRITLPIDKLVEKINELITALNGISISPSGTTTVISFNDSNDAGTLTLLESQSPAIIVIDDVNAGNIVLPEMSVGIDYKIKFLVDITSNLEIDSLFSASDKYQGALSLIDDTVDGSPTVEKTTATNKIRVDGDGKGGKKGSVINLLGTTLTNKWLVDGSLMGEAPFSGVFDDQ